MKNKKGKLSLPRPPYRARWGMWHMNKHAYNRQRDKKDVEKEAMEEEKEQRKIEKLLLEKCFYYANEACIHLNDMHEKHGIDFNERMEYAFYLIDNAVAIMEEEIKRRNKS